MARVAGVSSDSADRGRLPALVAVGFAVALVTLALIGWAGWRLATGQAGGNPAVTDQDSQGALDEPLAGELVALAPGSGVELRLLGWQHAGDDAAGDRTGSAVAVATLRNVESRWTEFVLDVAAVDPDNGHILGFGTAQVADLQTGAVGTFDLTIPAGVPTDALLGVANVWGRTPGDPQIHPINFATNSVARASLSSAGATSGAKTTSTADWSEGELMTAASQFAASVAAMQADCRDDTSLAGLVCLSRRNFPDFLLDEPARAVLRGQPFFHQEADPTGPPRAFELSAPGDATACVGQRIDKQTSDQVAILGSCSQRGLYPGDGKVQALQQAQPGTSRTWPPVVAGAARVSTPVGSGGLPGVPVQAGGASTAVLDVPTVGDAVSLSDLAVVVDGVLVGLTAVPGLPSPTGTYTLVTITVTNRGSGSVNLSTLALTINETTGARLSLVRSEEGGTQGWPPTSQLSPAGVLPPGGTVSTTVVLDVATNQTAATATISEQNTGTTAVISLLPPPA